VAGFSKSSTRKYSLLSSQQQGDAQPGVWMNVQAQDDVMQQSRINAVREEHTAVYSY